MYEKELNAMLSAVRLAAKHIMSVYATDFEVEINPTNAVPEMRKPNGHFIPDYREFEDMGREIKETLTQVRQQVRQQAAAAAAPKQAVTCPWCGATTTPDASGCCEYCGGSVNG